MTNIFQMNKFPINKVARIISLTVSYMIQTINIDYRDLELRIINDELCFYYKSDGGDLIIPIGRMSMIEKLK